MKILGISGGSRNGANDCMCKEALLAAQKEGAEIEFIRLMDLNIQHCTGCKACVMALFSGRGNLCVLKDDFEWLLDKMLDSDGIIFSIPIFEKCAAGIFHTLMDRFGPRMGRAHNIIAAKIAEERGGKPIDPRIIEERAVSYMAIGGSDWTTQVQCDFYLHSLVDIWKVIDTEAFQWSLGILSDQSKVEKAHNIGVNIARAAIDLSNACYQGDKGVCSHCHSRNFFIHEDDSVTCCQCGIVGKLKIDDGKITFVFADEQLEHAHDNLSGQFIHADDIQKNEQTAGQEARSEAYSKKVKAYAAAIEAVKP